MSKFKKVLSIFLTIVMMFTTVLSTGMIAHAAMLPLKEINACLALNGKSNDELSSMSLDVVLDMLCDSNGNKIKIANDATTVWRYVKDTQDDLETYYEYTIGADEKIDLSYPTGVTSYDMELIVGKDGQLNASNIRYIIKVYVSDSYSENINFELYDNASGHKTIVEPTHTDLSTGTYELSTIDGSTITAERLIYGQILETPISVNNAYLNITSERVKHPNITAKVWEWNHYGFNLNYGYEYYSPITEKVLNQDMSSSNAGISFRELGVTNYNSLIFVVLYYLDDELLDAKVLGLQFAAGYIAYDGGMYAEENGSLVNVTNNVIHSENVENNRVWEMQCELKDGYSTNDKYNFKLEVNGEGKINQSFNSVAEKAVVGHYDSLEAASGKADIKDKLLTDIGYNANYSGNGVDFTVFFPEGTFTDGNVKKFTIKATEYQDDWREFTEKPIIGEADPWFRVKGAESSNGKKYDTYVVENGKNINMDTYYGYGYQTIFINDANADLSNIKPDFWYANTDRVYAVSKDSGNRVDENHTRNFNNENQQYTGIIIDNDKENERNYWVTFKKLNNNGPELYVYGPNEREVILDEYFEFKHDILIANIGNAPLKDINVELLDAENVKLDPYWNVGGNGNDTLAAFTTTSSNTKYGELPNLAKIRLLPNGEGEVKGTLKITAQGQNPVLITLNGKAQNPEIITEKLSDAVKYVPYQQIVATNNMHDWISTQFNIVDGSLPDGVTLNSDTGEFYGVPTVPDGNENTTYKFTVEANYFVDGRDGYFEPSRKEFTLTVKPNTDENVYLASDINEGYSIKQHIGTQIGEYSFELETIEDTIFTSNGEYGEFVALYLNGEKLVEGIDYDSESGSTKITIKSQTMDNKTKPGDSNTIAMEFRKDTNGDGKGDSGADMNCTSQNFTRKTESNVDKVIKKIAALPSNITLKDKDAVQAARNAYDAISSADKNKVTNYSKLTAAENTIARLEKEERDRAAANNVIAIINALPSNITLNDKQAVNNARNAYNALTADQKKLVTNYDRLVKAETAIKQLEETEKNRVAANKVVSLINNLPNPITLDSKDAVTAARNAYNMLTASQKGYVTNYTKLQAAENTISELRDSNYEKVQTVTFVGILVNKDGKALSDMIAEIHSVVQKSRTDENGSFQLNNVEFGKHIVYVKDARDNVIAQREFNITLGSPLTLNENDIIAENGSVFTVKMQLDNGVLSFLNIEDGNKAPIVDTSKSDKDSESIYIGEGDKTITDKEKNPNTDSKSPLTGDNTNNTLWFALLIASLCGLTATAYSEIKRRKRAR